MSVLVPAMSVLVPERPIEDLAREAPPTIELSRENKDRVAALAWELTRKQLATMPSAPSLPAYADTTEEFRAQSRRTVTRILQALKMLGYIE